MKVQTNSLIGRTLNWAVAACEGHAAELDYGEVVSFKYVFGIKSRRLWQPSTSWQQGGPIIEREKIAVWFSKGDWNSQLRDTSAKMHGPTPLIAAMRCYVASKLGDVIDVPDELLISNRTWHNGPPPHIGWWNASNSCYEGAWRWWDGTVWSLIALDIDTAQEAAAQAKERAVYQDHIQWTDYWPENARVPRIDPRSK